MISLQIIRKTKNPIYKGFIDFVALEVSRVYWFEG